MCTFSRELLDDFTGSFMEFIPLELTKSVVDAETSFIVNNDDTTNGWSPGLLNTPGTLTRDATQSDTPIDALVQAISDVRSGNSYGVVDLIAMHPDTWMGLRTQKATTGLYLLNQSDPNDLGQSMDTFFRTKVIQNTWIPMGTAIAMDSYVSTIGWTRMGMEIMSNWAGDTEFGEFAWSFRPVERIAIGVQRPTGICVITGLPYTPWGPGS